MVRQLRIQFPGALYHIVSRGNEQKPIVRDDADREKRLDWLRRTVETYGWRLHAFSSYCGYVRGRRALDWVCYRRVLAEFGRDVATARRAYGRFVRACMDEPPRSPFHEAIGGLALGSDTFVAQMRRLLAERPADGGLPQINRLRPQPSLTRIISDNT